MQVVRKYSFSQRSTQLSINTSFSFCSESTKKFRAKTDIYFFSQYQTQKSPRALQKSTGALAISFRNDLMVVIQHKVRFALTNPKELILSQPHLTTLLLVRPDSLTSCPGRVDIYRTRTCEPEGPDLESDAFDHTAKIPFTVLVTTCRS